VHDGATLLDEPFKTKGHTMDFLTFHQSFYYPRIIMVYITTLMCQKFDFKGELAIVVG
jgi:hypothetical protein